MAGWRNNCQNSNYLKFIKIFITTEDKEELNKRLSKRNQNSNDEIQKRLKSFDDDIKHWNDYDYIIINKSLEVCFKQIENIISNNKKINLFHIIQ